ncbi:hypothetical protein MAM1_0032d02466 [Mucor ambiguus]|uniref:Uncharacterized protein n=1 Tax=Mucor ambiguus TaxID=91626 RepID=A0A0C9M2L0_9FUNG|nr:hypothetical protein MAM1_0032d02466 [Mucor ambiguus]
MSDNYHLSSNEDQHQHQHPQEFYPLPAQSSTESPSTTVSPISPMTTIVHQNQSWPSITQAIDQRHYYYDMNYHPQQQHQLQNQYWPNAYQTDPIYTHYSQPQSQQQRFQQNYPEPTYAPPSLSPHHHHHYQHPPSMARPVPTFYTTQQPMDNSFNAPMSNIESTFSGPSSTLAAPSIDQMQPIQHNNNENSRQSEEHDTGRLTTSPPPSETPMPSPIISGKRKRRGSTAVTSQFQRKKRIQNDAKDTSKEEGGSHGSHEKGDDENGVPATATTETRRVDATKDTHSNQTVDQLENELAFLRDECATILINLDSLRNAFLADIPSATTSTSVAKSNSSSATINFMIENVGSFSPTPTPSMQHHVDTSSATANNGDKRRRSKAMAQNAEMEREMRYAYDDLVLQVRQLEKKVERLEGKSKHTCLEDSSMNNNKKKHEDQMANLKDDIHELQQEDTNNDNGVDKTEDDGGAENSGEEDSSNPKGK